MTNRITNGKNSKGLRMLKYRVVLRSVKNEEGEMQFVASCPELRQSRRLKLILKTALKNCNVVVFV